MVIGPLKNCGAQKRKLAFWKFEGVLLGMELFWKGAKNR